VLGQNIDTARSRQSRQYGPDKRNPAETADS